MWASTYWCGTSRMQFTYLGPSGHLCLPRPIGEPTLACILSLPRDSVQDTGIAISFCISGRSLRCVQVLRPRGTFIDRVIRRLRFYREVLLSERIFNEIVLMIRRSTLCRLHLQSVGRCKYVRLPSTLIHEEIYPLLLWLKKHKQLSHRAS